MQKQTEDEWKTVQAGSRFITGTEGRYAVIELECLAIAWAIKKCHIFLCGSDHFTVITDHNPLVPVLNSHRLDEIENPRLQHLRTRLMGYNFTARWLKGAKIQAADALSRHPCCKPTQGDDLAEFDLLNGTISQIRAASTEHTWEPENLHLQELRRHAADDPEYQTLKELIMTGFPNERDAMAEPMKKYWAIKDRLSVDDDLVVSGCRLLIPRLGCVTQDFITQISPKQWQSGSNCQVANFSSMDRKLAAAIQEHPITQRWALPCPEATGTTSARQSTSSPQVLLARIATIIRGRRSTGCKHQTAEQNVL